MDCTARARCLGRFQPHPGLRADVSRLKLKWAFALSGARPTVIGDRLFITNRDGKFCARRPHRLHPLGRGRDLLAHHPDGRPVIHRAQRLGDLHRRAADHRGRLRRPDRRSGRAPKAHPPPSSPARRSSGASGSTCRSVRSRPPPQVPPIRAAVSGASGGARPDDGKRPCRPMIEEPLKPSHKNSAGTQMQHPGKAMKRDR